MSERSRPVAGGVGAAALLVAVAFALAGCGGSSEPSASETYANGVCSSLSTWITDVQATVKSLTDAGLSITQEDIQTAYDQTKESTDSMVNDLEALGAPDTEDGQKAKSEIDKLIAELQQQLDVIEQAISSGSGSVQIAATVSTAVSTAVNAVNTTFQQLRDLDPAGELRDAFESSDDCNSLQDQIAELRSGGR